MDCRNEGSFWRLIGYTGHVMRNYADQQLRDYELTVEQLLVLKHLDEGVGISQRALCRLTAKSPANLTRILDRLERKKRIARLQNPDDRRSSLILLTAAGERLHSDVKRLFERLQQELVVGIDPEKQRIAIEVLRGIQENIDTMSNAQGQITK
jgi:DNA-binding MarR family transcriptional regulator